MRNYLAAECYKVFRRKYLYLTLIVVLVLEGVLLWGCWLTSSWGNEGMNFYSASTLVAAMLSIGVYATILTCDMVFSEQYKQNTMKNEVAYGLPRVRIYLGKLAVSALVSILAAVVMVVLYVTGCWALLPHGDTDAAALTLIGYSLLGAFPLWLAAQGITMACYFIVRNTTLAAFVSVGLLGVVPGILQALGLLFHPVFERVRQLMPTVMLEKLPNVAFRMDYVGLCWLVGIVLLVLSIVVGLVAFQKKEIR